MKAFHLQIATPDGISFDGEAVSLLVRTVSGDVEILAGHTELTASLATGRVRLKTESGERFASASGGFLSVTRDGVILVTTTFEFQDEIDLARAEAARNKAEELIKTEKDERLLRALEAKLARAICRINVAKM